MSEFQTVTNNGPHTIINQETKITSRMYLSDKCLWEREYITKIIGQTWRMNSTTHMKVFAWFPTKGRDGWGWLTNVWVEV